jgi:hypothetical protein
MSTGVHLSLLAGPTVAVPVPSAVIDALVRVQTTTSAKGASGFQLTFALGKKSPLHTAFLLATAQTPLMRVIVVVTARGVSRVLIDGVTTRTEVAGGASTTLTVTGEDITRSMSLQDMSGIPYPAMPPEARVALILARYALYGVVPMIIPSPWSEVPSPTERIPTHQGSDLQYIQQLARESGYVFYIEPGPMPGMNTAYWGPEVKFGVPQPALNVDMDGHSNVEGISFAFNTADTTLPIVFIQNSLSKFAIPIPIPKINPLQPPLGLFPAPFTNVNLMRDTAKLSPVRALAAGFAESAKSADAVSASGTLNALRYGHILRARGLVGVRGAGAAYDGLYYVSSVSSTITRGELKQSFTLTRNGLVSTTPVVMP